MSQSQFRPHGHAYIAVDGQVLTVHMHGDWNQEMRTETAQQMTQHVPKLQETGPWAIVNVLHDTLIFDESIYMQTRQSYAQRPPHSRLCAVAFVIGPNAQGAGLLRHRFEGLLQDILPAQVFADETQAAQWAQQQITQTR
ncbi:MAG: hypothetical protein E6Q78_02510 [Rhodoferax sp.]|nr:MAG: hypothetical protein E6Q78_02510 [Rhodoferax sp.]